jgi:hypothetical protein
LKDFPSFLQQIQQHLQAAELSWCLIGGLAVGARSEPRFTKDLDLAVATSSDQTSEELIFSLQGSGYRVLAILEQQSTGRLATVRLSPPEAREPVLIDLLFASSGIEGSIAARAQLLEVFPQLWVPVASLGDLVAMKVLARDDQLRPQDRLDLQALLGRASPSDLEAARHALREISKLGYNRGRMLEDELAEFMASLS